MTGRSARSSLTISYTLSPSTVRIRVLFRRCPDEQGEIGELPATSHANTRDIVVKRKRSPPHTHTNTNRCLCVSTLVGSVHVIVVVVVLVCLFLFCFPLGSYARTGTCLHTHVRAPCTKNTPHPTTHPLGMHPSIRFGHFTHSPIHPPPISTHCCCRSRSLVQLSFFCLFVFNVHPLPSWASTHTHTHNVQHIVGSTSL